MPASTLSKLRGTRVIAAKVSASTASMLTVTRFSPASFNGRASPSSKCPFVVKARSSGTPASPTIAPIRQISRAASTTARAPSPPVPTAAAAPLRSAGSSPLPARRTTAPSACSLQWPTRYTARPRCPSGNKRICSCSGRHRDAKVRNGPAKLVPQPARRPRGLVYRLKHRRTSIVEGQGGHGHRRRHLLHFHTYEMRCVGSKSESGLQEFQV